MNEVRNPLTIRALAVGILGLIIITASSAYVALRMGALPWPTVFVTVLSMAVLGKAKGSTLEEINCTHTLMSAGAMVAGGLAFTLPGLSMIAPGEELPLFQIAVIAVTGAVLGTLFTIIFRKTFIEKEKLPYPMGEAAYNTLIAGKEGKGAPLLFTSLGLSAVFTYIRDGLGKIPAVLTLFSGSTLFPSLAIWVSPMALGIGAIIGPVLALVWLLGAIIGYFIITPAGLGLGLFQSMAEADVFRSNLGIGFLPRQQYIDSPFTAFGLPQQTGQIPVGIGTRHNVDQMFLLDQSLAKPFGHTPDHTDQQLLLLFIGLELPQTAENPLFGIVPYGAGIDQNHIRLVQMFRVAVSRILHDG